MVAGLGALVLRVHAGGLTDAGEFRGYYSAAAFVENLTILSAVLTVVTGLLISWLTAWGFFKYWSVIIQLIAAIIVIPAAIIWLAPAADTIQNLVMTQGLAARESGEFIRALRTAMGFGALNVSILAATIMVAALKPWGKTRNR